MIAPLAITLLGLNYAPESTGIAPYTAGLARGLALRGHRVNVVTAHPHYPQWRIEDGYGDWTRSTREGDVEVTRVRHYVPPSPGAVRRGISEVSFGTRLFARSWTDADAVVCVSPALISSAMALSRGRLSRRRPALGLLMQDLYSVGLAEANSPSFLVRFFTGVERYAVARADGVAVIHEQLKARVVNELRADPSRVSVVRNWTHIQTGSGLDRAQARELLGWPAGATVVLHTGAMGEKRGLASVVDAGRIAQAEGRHVLFVLVGDGSERADLEARAEGLATVRFMDPLADDVYSAALRAADVLLVNEKRGVCDLGVPSKLTSYFSAGVPVVAATEATSASAAELRAARAGVRAEPSDPAALLAAVDDVLLDPERAAGYASNALEYCANVLSESSAIDAYEAWIGSMVSERASTGETDRATFAVSSPTLTPEVDPLRVGQRTEGMLPS